MCSSCTTSIALAFLLSGCGPESSPTTGDAGPGGAAQITVALRAVVSGSDWEGAGPIAVPLEDEQIVKLTLNVHELRARSDRDSSLQPMLESLGPVDLLVGPRDFDIVDALPATYGGVRLVLEATEDAPSFEIRVADSDRVIAITSRSNLELEVRCATGVNLQPGQSAELRVRLDVLAGVDELEDGVLPPADASGTITIDETTAGALLGMIEDGIESTATAGCTPIGEGSVALH